ncbi:MAG TPA: nuclear transport factor 2 family protein [Caldimonas sp.]
MTTLVCATLLAVASFAGDSLAQDAAIDAGPLPLATKRVAAKADECAVWRREQSFARSVERHDAGAFASHLHAGAVFNAGTAEADRGRDTVLKEWAEIVDGKRIALRWRPGIVQIGGEPGVAVSRGPYILERRHDGAPVFRVGMYQTVWLRDARDGVWRVLFDGSATSSQTMDSRVAADRWVEQQAMSDCAP